MPWTVLLAYIYGALMIVLGIAGFAHKGSVISLIAGSVLGILGLVGGYLAKHHPRVAFAMVGVSALLTLGQFAMKFVKSKEIYPDGVITAVAVLGLIAAIGGFMGAAK